CLGTELAFGRHLKFGVLLGDRFDEQALVRITWDDGRSGVAAFEQAGPRINLQAALLLAARLAVALKGVVGQDRTDFLFEEFELLARSCWWLFAWGQRSRNQ